MTTHKHRYKLDLVGVWVYAFRCEICHCGLAVFKHPFRQDMMRRG